MSNRRISKKFREIPILFLCPASTELVLFGIYENTRTGIRGITASLFNGYVSSSVLSLDNISQMQNIADFEKISWGIQVLRGAKAELEKLPEAEGVPLLDGLRLLDDPNILRTAQMLFPLISNYFKEGLENQYRLFVYIPEKIGSILQVLKPEDRPSELVKEFIVREFARDNFTLEVKE